MTRGFLSEGANGRPVRLTDIACEVWLPKSQVENNGDGTFTLPEWLAQEKGLI